jgi:putative copper export protein/methionine-rich copper-binding protein CopC
VNRGPRRAAGLLAVVLAVGATVLGGASPAAAAQLVTSDPRQGSIIGGTVREVRLTFSEAVELPVVEVIDAAGTRVDGPPRVENTQVVVPLDEEIVEGPVKLTWRAKVGGDSLRGNLGFTIGMASPAASSLTLSGPARTQESSDADSLADTDPTTRGTWAALRGAGLIAVMLALGAGLFAALAHDGGRDRRRLVLVTSLGALAGTGLVTGAALLGDETLSRRETLCVGLLAAGAFLVVVGAAFARPGRGLPRAAVVVGTVIAGFSFAPSGHAAASGSPVVAETALAVHVVAMGLWLGGLVGVGLTLAHRRHVRTAGREAQILRRYGMIAAGSVAAGLTGGLVLAALALPGWSSLWGSRWGLVLSGKALAVLGVVLLAAMNRGALTPPGEPDDHTQPLLAETPAFASIEDGDLDIEEPRDGPPRRGLRLRLGAEAVVLAVAAGVSGLLVQADPGAGARDYLHVVPMGNRIAAIMSDDLTAGRPEVRVAVRTFSGQVDTHVTQLSVRVSGPDGKAGPRYDLTRPALHETFDMHVPLPSTGHWTMEMSYRVSDVDRGDATIVLPVG